jgi:protein-disulfide isomerase
MDSSKRQARQDRRQAEQRKGQTKLIIYMVIIAVILAVLVIIAQGLSKPTIGTYTQKDGVSLGDPSAPVTMIEFVDFQCAFCLSSYNSVERPIIEQYVETGQLLYVYQPVGFLGPESVASAQAAYCAANQNYFWEYHDVLFAPANFSNGNTGGYSEQNLIAFANEVEGLDVAAFTQCLASGETVAMVEAAHAQASSMGVTGTPGFVINNTVLSGEQPLARLQQTIDEAIAASGN